MFLAMNWRVLPSILFGRERPKFPSIVNPTVHASQSPHWCSLRLSRTLRMPLRREPS
jgi:hypothetical protein